MFRFTGKLRNPLPEINDMLRRSPVILVLLAFVFIHASLLYFFAYQKADSLVSTDLDNARAQELLFALHKVRSNPDDDAAIDKAKLQLSSLYYNMLNESASSFSPYRTTFDSSSLNAAVDQFSDRVLQSFVYKASESPIQKQPSFAPLSDTSHIHLQYGPTVELFQQSISPILSNEIVTLLGKPFDLPIVGSIVAHIVRPISDAIVSGLVRLDALVNSMTIINEQLERVSQDVLKLSTVEASNTDIIKNNYVQDYWLFKSRSHVSFRYKICSSAGFDIKKGFSIYVDHSSQQYHITLPEPEILSSGVCELVLNDWDEDFLADVNKYQIDSVTNAIMRAVRDPNREQALIDSAKTSARKTMPDFLGGILAAGTGGAADYDVLVSFANDSEFAPMEELQGPRSRR